MSLPDLEQHMEEDDKSLHGELMGAYISRLIYEYVYVHGCMAHAAREGNTHGSALDVASIVAYADIQR